MNLTTANGVFRAPSGVLLSTSPNGTLVEVPGQRPVLVKEDLATAVAAFTQEAQSLYQQVNTTTAQGLVAATRTLLVNGNDGPQAGGKGDFWDTATNRIVKNLVVGDVVQVGVCVASSTPGAAVLSVDLDTSPAGDGSGVLGCPQGGEFYIGILPASSQAFAFSFLVTPAVVATGAGIYISSSAAITLSQAYFSILRLKQPQ